LLVLILASGVASAQNVKLNRPSHDGSRLVITDFDNCGSSEGTPLGDYQVSIGMAYYQSPSGEENWYFLVHTSLVGNRLVAYKGDKLLVKCKSGRLIEVDGLFNTDCDMLETLVHTFGISTAYFSYLYRSVENTYHTTQWYKITEEEFQAMCDGVEKVKFETNLNPVLIVDTKEINKFQSNCSYGYRKIKDAIQGPKFYDGFKD